MNTKYENGVPFDPGFIQHISAILPNIEYTYSSLDKYRNFGQKKNQFKIMFPRLEALIHKYIGFYSGCILWAQIIKSMDSKPITGNYCCGAEYDEDETLQEVRYLREYLKIAPQDVKYYIGKNYTVNPEFFEVLDKYEEFLKVNKGFIKVEKTDDIIIPENIKPVKDTQKVLAKIEEVVETGKLTELIEFLG